MKITLLIELKVDTDRFPELNEYTTRAVDDGWGNDPENGVWYLAQEICDENSRPLNGVHLEVLP
jgi:hypothetical protein